MKRNRIIYFLLCIAAIVLASFYGGPVSYSLLFGLLLITPVSLLYLLTVYIFFKLYQVVGNKHITAYEPVPYYFVLQNEYLLNFCNISIKTYSTFSYIGNIHNSEENTAEKHDDTSLSNVYELLPGENIRYDTNLICRYRGDYFVGIKEITIVDFFKLYRITYRVPEPLNAVVSPRIIKLESLRSIPEMTLSTFRENPHMSSDFDASVREYVAGDPIKAISWKASARTGSLKSRLTYGEQRQGIGLFLDTKRISDNEYTYIPVENKCLEIVLALANYFSVFSVPVTMYYSQSGPVSACCGNQSEMDSFLSSVNTLRFRDDEDSTVLLDSLIGSAAFANCMVVFLVITSADAELNRKLYSLSLTGVKTVIYYVGYNPRTEDIIELQDQKVFAVLPEDDISKIL